ncbi:TPA: hypothetical protein ACIET7_000458 [Streptococcus pyogenes]|uniref:Uncharacterized protein n=1 Tax=Streptococcus mitis TaxID=28037 RepID=A0A428E8Q8_STRMT|nr:MULTISPECIES: hypothetical protein [Streptococcus]KGE57558.1 putative membrane protein [Streptococcus pyogenes SS1447]RSI79060.1 hypothetical protein D8852_08975 [Streptococcus mitis]RSJ06436.1 hypothetical protein D8839_08615 [Streptococcus mitis]VGQ96647.1 Uncharacterised protein [Streptococcus pyogenes]VGU33085.1 Uncharacterised protein [Streptococcus pyogenes]
MRNYFWQTSTFVLLSIISVLAGFTADGINFKAYTPLLSAKVAVLLSAVVLVVQLPSLILLLVDKKCSKKLE